MVESNIEVCVNNNAVLGAKSQSTSRSAMATAVVAIPPWLYIGGNSGGGPWRCWRLFGSTTRAKFSRS